MEKNGISLDSLSRRRSLRFLLGIPSALLGLDAAHFKLPAPAAAPAAISPAAAPQLSEVQVFQSGLWTGYFAGHAQDQVRAARGWTSRIKDLLPDLLDAERPAWLEQQSLLFQGLANITREYADEKTVLQYSQAAVKYARLSGNTNLLGAALSRRAETLFVFGHTDAAAVSERELLALKLTDPIVISVAAGSSAWVLAAQAQNRDDRSEIRLLLDRVRPFDPALDQDLYSYKQGCDGLIVSIRRGQTLVNLAQNAPHRADLLNEASTLFEAIDLSQVASPRRVLFIKLAQARAYLGLKEYEYAAELALEAFLVMQQLKSVLSLPQFIELYQAFLQSPCAGSPLVARLGLLLFEQEVLV